MMFFRFYAASFEQIKLYKAQKYQTTQKGIIRHFLIYKIQYATN